MIDIFAIPPSLRDLIRAKRRNNKLYAQCADCLHYDEMFTCTAFVNIPPPILMGEHDHTKPYPGDNGIRFEPAQGTPNA